MIFLASDHAGYEAKLKVIKLLEKHKVEFKDLGTNTTDSVDYPDYAKKLAKELEKNKKAVGILICRTGIGMSIAINRFGFVRGALCRSAKDAYFSRCHNDANVLVLGATTKNHKRAKIIKTFLNTEFEGGRHERRVKKLSELV
ncbi:MAG: ribose 5-phosphate isomerase B [Clostridia bacterium]|nr:ribose 5-phosphate isomerase B [Clostridia bacterium]